MSGSARKRSLIVTLLSISCLVALPLRAQDKTPWSQLSLSTCGVDQYRAADATQDGRGIVVAVLDTGVDMGIPGLQKTSTGETKVIDVQDFSTQGDIDLKRALWNEAGDKIVRFDKDGAQELFTPPPGASRAEGMTVWFAMLDEKKFTNSSVRDVNDNGKKDDQFPICVVSNDHGTDGDAVCFIDMNLNRDFSDERPLKNYKLNLESFVFTRDKTEKQHELLTCGLNIFIKEQRLSLHFDDGGHGTHVAGIAAGHSIQSQEGFDGVAPGAKVISLKIGHNTLAGGATTTASKKKAFEYAANYAREHNVTVVCNLSYGVGSIREGHSDIDEFVDGILRKNPNLIICTSAGNAGPGLSSVGSPAAASSAISVAALVAVDTARDVRGEKIETPQLTEFSSRGGELNKPDIATPGMITSTVPRWEQHGDFWQGTSMASPYATGMSALVAQKMRTLGITPRCDWVKLALQASAEPLAKFTTLDYGAGVPNMTRAAQIAEQIASSHKDQPLYGFEVSTASPLASDGKAPAAYWRTSTVPSDRPQVFNIKPIYMATQDTKSVADFSKRLILKSDAPWCSTKQTQIYFRGEQSATVNVEYDASQLKEPGLYVATITGMDGDLPVLRLVNSVIVPHRVSADSKYELDLPDQSVYGWQVKRHFVEVPAGATAMHVTLEAVENKPSSARMYYIFRPDGRSLDRRYPVRLDTKNEIKEAHHTVFEDLEPGIWELPVSSTKTDETSSYRLRVRFDGVKASPERVTSISDDPAGKPSGKVTFTNVLDRRTNVRVEGEIEGYRKFVVEKLSPDKDKAEITLSFTSSIRAARIKVEISDEDYARLTDCAVNVLDSKGSAFVRNGMNEPEVIFTAENPEPDAESATCKLAIQPAFALPKIEKKAEFKIKIDYLYAKSIPIKVKRGDESATTLYSGVPTEFSYEIQRCPPKSPNGTSTVGYIRAVESTTNQPVAKIEIKKK